MPLRALRGSESVALFFLREKVCSVLDGRTLSSFSGVQLSCDLDGARDFGTLLRLLGDSTAAREDVERRRDASGIRAPVIRGETTVVVFERGRIFFGLRIVNSSLVGVAGMFSGWLVGLPERGDSATFDLSTPTRLLVLLILLVVECAERGMFGVAITNADLVAVAESSEDITDVELNSLFEPRRRDEEDFWDLGTRGGVSVLANPSSLSFSSLVPLSLRGRSFFLLLFFLSD